MEKKTRGKIAVDKSKTPLENIISMLAQVYPTELTAAKLGENFTKCNRDINFMGITIYAMNVRKNNSYDHTDFARIAFETDAGNVLKHRSTQSLSIPIKKGKVSISGIIWAVEKCTETKKKNNEIREAKKAAREAKEAAQAAKEKELQDFKNEAHFSENVSVSESWRDDGKYNIGIDRISKETAIAIGKAIYNAGIRL